MSGRVQLKITVHIEDTIRELATFVFVSRVNCVHRLISPDPHLSVFCTEMVSSKEIIRAHFNYFILSRNCRNIDIT